MTTSNNRLLATLIVLQSAILILLAAIFLRAPAQHGHAAAEENVIGHAHALTEQRWPVTAEFKSVLREIIRDELTMLPVSAPPVTDNAVSEPEKVLSENERHAQETAAAISTSIVQQATSAGVWTRADTEALLPHIARLSEEQRWKLTDQLFTSINRQELEIEDFPPL